jgi:hypothetical protein
MYSGKEVTNEDLMWEWEETLLKDFLKESKKWLWKNMAGNTFWRVGLE